MVGGEIPYRPEALAKKEQNFADRLVVDHDNVNTVGDPEAKCYLPGVPRATYMPFPFQIIQSTDIRQAAAKLCMTVASTFFLRTMPP